MKLTNEDKKIFEVLNKNEVGKWLVDYLERLNVDLFNPDEVNEKNILARKDTIAVIKKELIDRIKIVNKENKTKGMGQYV